MALQTHFQGCDRMNEEKSYRAISPIKLEPTNRVTITFNIPDNTAKLFDSLSDDDKKEVITEVREFAEEIFKMCCSLYTMKL